MAKIICSENDIFDRCWAINATIQKQSANSMQSPDIPPLQHTLAYDTAKSAIYKLADSKLRPRRPYRLRETPSLSAVNMDSFKASDPVVPLNFVSASL